MICPTVASGVILKPHILHKCIALICMMSNNMCLNVDTIFSWKLDQKRSWSLLMTPLSLLPGYPLPGGPSSLNEYCSDSIYTV